MKIIGGLSLSSLALLLVLAVASVLAPITPAHAEAAPTELTLTGPASAPPNEQPRLTATLTTGGAPLAGQAVRIERLSGQSWTPISTGTTDAAGQTSYATPVVLGANTFRAVYDGDAANAAALSKWHVINGVRRPTRITLTGPGYVTDEYSTNLNVTWRADNGALLGSGLSLRVYSRGYSGGWVFTDRVYLDANGQGTLRITPRSDRFYIASGSEGAWWAAASSPQHFIDNRPPIPPVAYPSAAPKPLAMAPQGHGLSSGANAEIVPIPDNVWANMVGKSWRSGCPVGRSQLRLIRINYWDFAGYRRRGELIVRDTIAQKTAGALGEMYGRHFPLRGMYRVDVFGYSARSGGADDYSSMAHDNTSAFNCRWVTGNPGVVSPHSYGKAIDLNTWENPYKSKQGILPNTWWYPRSHPLVAWRSKSHPVVEIWTRHGFKWAYGVTDSQHMEGRRMVIQGTFVAD